VAVPVVVGPLVTIGSGVAQPAAVKNCIPFTAESETDRFDPVTAEGLPFASST